MKKLFRIVSAVAVLSAVLALAACQPKIVSQWVVTEGRQTVTLTFSSNRTGTVIITGAGISDGTFDFTYRGDTTKDGAVTITTSDGDSTAVTISENTLSFMGYTFTKQ